MNVRLISVAALALSLPIAAHALDYNPAGVLVSGSGSGAVDSTVYSPDMRFPMEETPAFANSQVYGHGGYLGPGGGQCDAENYSFPWWDNFCETRSWVTPMCPTGNGHQGQDIRAATCADSVHWVVAAEDGTITSVGVYTVDLISDSGNGYRYMHMNMGRLAVSEGQRVSRGDRLGLVSNDFGGTATTYHLHIEIHQNVAAVGGMTPVPLYTSLVESYEELEGGGPGPDPCPALPAAGGIIDDDSRCFTAFGPGEFWRPVNGWGEGGSFLWTHGWVNDEPSNWARWRVNLDAAGRYEVLASNLTDWIEANGHYQSTISEYRVRAGGSERTIVVDQGDGDGWVSLGEFDFAAGGDQWVDVYDNSGEDGALQAKIVADAIRLRPADGGGSCDPVECANRGTCGAWSPCGGFADGCDDTGVQTRTCETYSCSGDSCVAGNDRTEEQACTRSLTDDFGEWAPVSECGGFESLCDESGVVTEARDACVGGVPSSETRDVACTRSTDGIVTGVWGAWGTCDGTEEARSRTVCEAGLETEEVQTRTCSDTNEPRTPPTVRRSSGCTTAPGAPGAGALLLLGLALVRRRRRA